MAVQYGSKRLVVGAHYGIRDWLVQRLTAVLMAVFILVLLLRWLMASQGGYLGWSSVFAPQWMKMLTFVTIVGLAWHAWVGMRDIWMDYMKSAGMRLVAETLTIIWLIACAGWAIQVLWRL